MGEEEASIARVYGHADSRGGRPAEPGNHWWGLERAD
jgi:hypothetical protein